VRSAEILDDLAIQILGPEVALRLCVEDPGPPELLGVFEEQIAPASLTRRLPQVPGRHHRPGCSPQRLIGRVGDVRLDRRVDPVFGRSGAGQAPQHEKDAHLAEEIGRHDFPGVRMGVVRSVSPSHAFRRIAAQLDRPFALQVRQHPQHPRASEVEAVAARCRRIAFIVERMHGPVSFGELVLLDIVDNGLDGFARRGSIPGGIAKRFVALGFEDHGWRRECRNGGAVGRRYYSWRIVKSCLSGRSPGGADAARRTSRNVLLESTWSGGWRGARRLRTPGAPPSRRARSPESPETRSGLRLAVNQTTPPGRMEQFGRSHPTSAAL